MYVFGVYGVFLLYNYTDLPCCLCVCLHCSRTRDRAACSTPDLPVPMSPSSLLVSQFSFSHCTHLPLSPVPFFSDSLSPVSQPTVALPLCLPAQSPHAPCSVPPRLPSLRPAHNPLLVAGSLVAGRPVAPAVLSPLVNNRIAPAPPLQPITPGKFSPL
jgi:hypothetical protein